MAVVGGITVYFRANTAQLTSGINQVRRQAREASRDMVNSYGNVRASLGLLDNAIRGNHAAAMADVVREFSQTSFVMNALPFAAAAGGFLLLVGVIAEAARKVRELRAQAHEAAAKMAEGFEKIHAPLQAENDELELSNVKLHNVLEKLEGKPENHLAEALAEARAEADKLSDSLAKTIEQTAKLLKDQDRSYVMQLLSGETGTGQSQVLLQQFKERISLIPKGEHYEEDFDRIAQEYWQRAERKIGIARMGVRDNNTPINADMRNEISGLQTFQQILSDANWKFAGTDDHIATGQAVDVKKDSAQARKDAAEAGKKADDAEWQEFEKHAAVTADGHKRSLAEELNYWEAIHRIRSGNIEKLQDAINKAMAAVREAQEKSGAKGVSWMMPVAADQVQRVPEIAPPQLGVLSSKQDAAEEIKAAGEARRALEEAWKNSGQQLEDVSQRAALAVKQLALDEQTGQMTRSAAALALMGIHTDAYTQKLGELLRQQQMLNAERERMLNLHTLHQDGLDETEFGNQLQANQDKLDANRRAQGDLNTGYRIEHGEDLWAADAQTARRGVHDFFQAAIEEAQDSATKVRSILKQAQDGFNNEIANAITGKKTDFGRVFEGLAHSTLTAGLQKMEGGIFDKLGFGKLGTRTNPMITQDVNGPAGIGGGSGGSGVGSIFGKLLGFLHIPGFASGGDPTGLALVGENGPELANFGGGGHVTNNRDTMRLLRGSGGNVSYHIDAREASNPVETEMRIRRALQQVHAQAVGDAARAQHERQLRRPRSS